MITKYLITVEEILTYEFWSEFKRDAFISMDLDEGENYRTYEKEV